MRASRLLSIQMLLETRGRMSARQLAATLEVSLRTLHRDIDELSAAGVPIFAERGRNGGFQLLAGWKTTLTGFTPSEAQAVFLSGLAGPAAELGLGENVARAQLKMLASLPESWRDDARRVSARLHLDPLDWYREADPLPQLQQVASAVWNERQLSFCYESWKSTARRTAHPLGLVLKAGTWYLIAARELKPRTYRVSNISDATVLEAGASRPPRFDLAGYWHASVRRFEAELFKGEAEVLASPPGLKALSYLSGAVARAVRAAQPSLVAGKLTRLRIPIESIEQTAGQMLRLAPEVEVIGPSALRRAVIERIASLRRTYGRRARR